MSRPDRAPALGSEEIEALAKIDRVVHSPARLLILAYLYVSESADFTFLMRETGLTRGNLSSHMSTLEEAGYIEVQKEFVNRRPLTLLRLTRRGRQAFRDYRRSLKGVLDDLPD
ncbi:MAG: transcriptional regulator [Anaerolineae bacterium]|nr:transcriptional regulator [Anaerolineae bacterium]